VGKGGVPKAASSHAKKTYTGKGTVIALQPRKGQIVVDHEEIKGFMAAMIMGYPVDPVSLLENFKPGDVVRFTIDPKKKVIVDIKRWNAPRAGGR
jgi:Cu/Ag efflux protein CusF